MVLPNEGVGFWPLISMGAILGGTMRSPFTGIVFAVELTHDMNVILPLLVACVIAHFFTLKRSILTEKVARRGYHLSREYAVDPLEILFAREVMRNNVAVLPLHLSRKELSLSLHTSRRGQRVYPVVGSDGALMGLVARKDLQKHAAEGDRRELADFMRKDPGGHHLARRPAACTRTQSGRRAPARTSAAHTLSVRGRKGAGGIPSDLRGVQRFGSRFFTRSGLSFGGRPWLRFGSFEFGISAAGFGVEPCRLERFGRSLELVRNRRFSMHKDVIAHRFIQRNIAFATIAAAAASHANVVGASILGAERTNACRLQLADAARKRH